MSHSTESELVLNQLSRRKVLASMTAAVAAGLVSPKIFNSAFAQDATPEAEASLPVVPPETETFAADWPMAQANFAATREARGTTIDASNVGELGVAWTLPLDADSGWGAITSNPIVLGDTVYIIDQQGNVQSVNKETGEVNWRNDYNVPTTGPNGLAIGYGYLLSVLGDTAEVLCLRPETGEEVWRFQLTNHGALGITMAPFIYDGYVIVSSEPGGNTKGNYEGGAEGIVFCLDIETGITLWQWNTVEDDAWGNFRVNNGGGLWYPPSVDVETGVLYMGIGNAAPFYGEHANLSTRPGQNEYANHLVALDPNQGKVLWAVNLKPNDLFDHDNQQTPVLADVAREDGSIVKLVFSAGKHGFVNAVDRTSGIELWKVPVGEHKNDTISVLGEEYVEVLPGIFGGVESPLAYKDGVVYAVVLNAATSWNMYGMDYAGMNLGAATGNVVAIDALTGRIIWDVQIPTGIAGPGPVIANDLLFTGGLDGIVRAFNLADGSLAWSYQTAAGLNAPFAIAGDMLFVPAGSFVLPSADTQEQVTELRAEVIAFKLGVTSDATPSA